MSETRQIKRLKARHSAKGADMKEKKVLTQTDLYFYFKHLDRRVHMPRFSTIPEKGDTVFLNTSQMGMNANAWKVDKREFNYLGSKLEIYCYLIKSTLITDTKQIIDGSPKG